MDTPSPSIRELARQLLALEEVSPSVTEPRVHETIRVFEKLRVVLTRFAGADGFTALLGRALALARAEVPGLHDVTGNAQGSMEGLQNLTADSVSLASRDRILFRFTSPRGTGGRNRQILLRFALPADVARNASGHLQMLFFESGKCETTDGQ